MKATLIYACNIDVRKRNTLGIISMEIPKSVKRARYC